MSIAGQVSKLYNTVVEDVINNVKEAFLDEGVDEQVLQDLKQLWESKLASSKALEPPPSPQIKFPMPQGASVTLPKTIQASSVPQRPQVPQNAQPSQPQFQPNIAATAGQAVTPIALPQGLFQQQLSVLGNGQMQNITLQQTGSGQFITVAGLPQLQQLQRLQGQAQQLQGQPQHIQGQTQIPGQAPGLPPQQQQQIRQFNLQQTPQLQQLQQQQQQQQRLLQPGAILQQNAARPALVKGQTFEGMIQLDGCADTSSSDEDLDGDDDKEEDGKDDLEEEDPAEEEDPLNSDDDISEEDPTELFDSDNVVVCQYDKINRNRNKWKFHLKDGIMSLNGRDFVFQKATGDSEW